MRTFGRSGCGLLLLACSPLAVAHQDLSAGELEDYHKNLKRNGEALSRCLESPEMREHNARMLVHHDDTLRSIRKARGMDTELDIEKRDQADVAKWAAVKHEQEPGPSRDPQDLFNFRWNQGSVSNPNGCALTPQSLYGPYWIEGQPNRSDIRDCQEGIYLHLAMQIIDIATCKPLPHAQVDVWHANATGQYSLTKGGFLRGWQPTSKHGTVEFDTNFPGHYTDRATHIHTVVRAPNEQRVAHFGQIYFDQWLRDVLEQTTKYKGNQQPLVENLKDDFLPFDASDKHDPFVRWSRIGNSPYDGVLAWITLGVDTTDFGLLQPPKPGQKRGMIDWHLD